MAPVCVCSGGSARNPPRQLLPLRPRARLRASWPNVLPARLAPSSQAQAHPRFRREGNDLWLPVNITLVDALTGFALEVGRQQIEQAGAAKKQLPMKYRTAPGLMSWPCWGARRQLQPLSSGCTRRGHAARLAGFLATHVCARQPTRLCCMLRVSKPCARCWPRPISTPLLKGTVRSRAETRNLLLETKIPQRSSRAGGAARSAPGVAARYPHTVLPYIYIIYMAICYTWLYATHLDDIGSPQPV